MIVNRRTIVVNKGCREKIIAMIQEARAQVPHPRPWRIYTPNIAPFDTLAFETEYESLEEYQGYWERWHVHPGAADFMKRWQELVGLGGTNELWNLEE